jgi:hypothetical protein
MSKILLLLAALLMLACPPARAENQALGEAHGIWRQHHGEKAKSFAEMIFGKQDEDELDRLNRETEEADEANRAAGAFPGTPEYERRLEENRRLEEQHGARSRSHL